MIINKNINTEFLRHAKILNMLSFILFTIVSLYWWIKQSIYYFQLPLFYTLLKLTKLYQDYKKSKYQFTTHQYITSRLQIHSLKLVSQISSQNINCCRYCLILRSSHANYYCCKIDRDKAILTQLKTVKILSPKVFTIEDFPRLKPIVH